PKVRNEPTISSAVRDWESVCMRKEYFSARKWQDQRLGIRFFSPSSLGPPQARGWRGFGRGLVLAQGKRKGGGLQAGSGLQRGGGACRMGRSRGLNRRADSPSLLRWKLLDRQFDLLDCAHRFAISVLGCAFKVL